MKNRHLAIILFFAAFLSVNGLNAQMPEPVSGQGTDQEVQKEPERSGDRTYERKETRERKTWGKDQQEHTQQAESRRRSGGDQSPAGCQGGKDKKEGWDDHGKNEKHESRPDKKDNEGAGQWNRGQMKEHKDKEAKGHPNFEARSNAGHGKGGKCN